MTTLNSFVLYKNQWKGLKELNFVELGMLFSAIFRHLNEEDEEQIEKSLPNNVLVAYRFMTLQIEIDFAKYLDKLEKNRERLKEYRERKKCNVYNKDKDNDKDNDNDKDKDNDIDKDKDKDNAADAADKEWQELPPSAAAAAADFDLEKAKEYNNSVWLPFFNQILDANESKIPRIREFNDKRVIAFVKLYRKYGREQIALAFRNAARSPFLNGDGKRNKFVATFDWIIDEAHFLKVCEGEYNTQR